jgi:hypothetical protein
LLLSCAYEDLEDRPKVVASPSEPEAPSAAPTEAAVESTPHTAPSAAETMVPRGVFPTIDELCAEQKRLIVPHLLEAQRASEERGEKVTIVPACDEDPKALAHARIALAAPYLEVRAIAIETGNTAEIHLVVRTEDGWRASLDASITDWHDDPGCPSTFRDREIGEVRVEGTDAPALVELSSASRGAGEEYLGSDADGHEQVTLWNIVVDRARACRIEGDNVVCDKRSVFRAVRETWEPGAQKPTGEAIFATSYLIDDAGHVRVADKYVDGLHGTLE